MKQMSRCVVSVATDSWTSGLDRLLSNEFIRGENVKHWRDRFPVGCPPHRTRGILSGHSQQVCIPYAFKAYALKEAADAGHTTLLWCDASIVPLKPLTELWEMIEREGVWFARNGWTNYQWTADSAYPDLFAHEIEETKRLHGASHADGICEGPSMDSLRDGNRKIPHVVATTFGLNLKHYRGRDFLNEYYRLASETRAFCGPWQNSAAPREEGRNSDRPAGYCGPEDVLGHRHDQSAASVIAWRLGVQLSDVPRWFAYDGGQTDETVLIARGV